MNDKYERFFNEEWKLIDKERLDKCSSNEKSQYEKLKNKLINNETFKLIKFSFDFKLYESFYLNMHEFYLSTSTNNEQVFFFGFLDKFHGGRLGYIHGGSSFYLTYICSSLLINEMKGEKWILANQKVNYKKKLNINSYIIIEAKVFFKDNNKLHIKSNLIDIAEDVCIESDFYYSIKSISF